MSKVFAPLGIATPSNQSNTVLEPQPHSPQRPLFRQPLGSPSDPLLQLLHPIVYEDKKIKLHPSSIACVSEHLNLRTRFLSLHYQQYLDEQLRATRIFSQRFDGE